MAEAAADAAGTSRRGAADVPGPRRELPRTEDRPDGLASSEHHWRALVDQAPVAVAVYGAADLRFRYANDQAAALYGVDAFDELLGRSYLDVIEPGDEWAFYDRLDRLTAGEQILAEASRILGFDGRRRVVEVNATRIDDGGVPAVQVQLRDVTSQAEALERLRVSEERFRRLWADAPVGVAEASFAGQILSVNPTLSRLLGYDEDELVGMPSVALGAGGTRPGMLADVRRLADDAVDSYTSERLYRRKDGSPVPVLVQAAVVRDAGGRPDRVIGTVLDISARVADERALQEAHAALTERGAFLEGLLDSVDVGIVSCDADGRLTMFNQASRAWHGLDAEAALEPDAMAGHYALFEADGTTPLSPARIPLLRALHEGSVRAAEIVIAPHGLPTTRVLCSGRRLTDETGRSLGAIVAMHDVTSLHDRTLALTESEERFRAAFDTAPIGIALATTEAGWTKVNPALCAMLQHAEAGLLAVRPLHVVHPEDRRDVAALYEQALTSPGRAFHTEKRLVRADGGWMWGLMSLTALPDDAGGGVLIQVQDVTERRAAQERLTYQALYDSVTSLPNRVMLVDRINHALARLQRSRGQTSVAALFIDLDGFKQVNDAHGHDAGDTLLAAAAVRLRSCVRPADTVARLGGDEFVVLCEDLRGPEDATVVAQRVEDALAEPYPYERTELRITASVGIAFASPALSAEELLRRADSAMYRAKRLGKDRYEIFDEDLRASSLARAEGGRQVREALAGDGVRVAYQPIVSLPDRRVVGVEALARIALPDGGTLMPAAFLPAAEDSGLIVELGRLVLEQACHQVSAWRARSGLPLHLAVNLSARQAARPDVVGTILGVLAATGLPASALSLELTESVLLEAGRSTLSKLVELRDAGVGIGIDDFGTGYGSLRHLRELPITFLKVDRSFVAGMHSSAIDRTIVRNVVRLAEELGLHCVVEGIETDEQLAEIGPLGPDGQGFLLGRPEPAEAIGHLLD